MTSYKIPNQQPDFSQSLPGDPDTFTLIEGNKRTGTLRYRDEASGETHLVPNVPYNQRSESRLRTLEFQLDQINRSIQQQLQEPGGIDPVTRTEFDRQIAALSASRDALRRKIASL